MITLNSLGDIMKVGGTSVSGAFMESGANSQEKCWKRPVKKRKSVSRARASPRHTRFPENKN